MSDTLAVVIGLVIGVLASVPMAVVIAAPTRRKSRLAERPENALSVRAEIVTDGRLAISKDDYLASVVALGNGMASPDPYTRNLAAMAYDAFRDAVIPS